MGRPQCYLLEVSESQGVGEYPTPHNWGDFIGRHQERIQNWWGDERGSRIAVLVQPQDLSVLIEGGWGYRVVENLGVVDGF